MSFLNPLFLIALISIGIPLLIYLLNIRKPKRIRFSTLAFFDSLKSSSLRKIKLKRWLLLALRTLAVAALALALAKPFLPSGFGLISEGEPAVVGIMLDNSPAMNQIDRNGPYIEQAKELASDIIGLQDYDNRFAVNIAHGESLSLPLLSKSAAEREIQQVETANAGNYLAQNMQNLIGQLKNAPEPNKILYIITDGRESQLEALRELYGDDRYEDLHVKLIKLGEAEPSNTGIRDVEVRTSDDGNLLAATVQNYGTQATGNQFFNFYLDDELIAQQAYDIESGAARDFHFEIPESDQLFLKAELEIEGDELSFDNKFYAAIQLPEQRRVLVVNENSASGNDFRSYLRPLLEAVSEESDRLIFNFETVDNLSPGQFEEMDAIVLDGVRSIPDYLSQVIIERVQEGSGLLLLPASDGRIDSYNRLLGISNAGRYSNLVGSYGSFQGFDQLAAPRQGHPILDAMFDVEEGDDLRVNLPELFYYYRINTIDGQASNPVLTSRAGNVILNETTVGSGKLIYSAIGSDPGWSNFPVKPLFAPLFYRTVDYLASGEGAKLNNHMLGEPFENTLAGASPGSVELVFNDEPIIPATRQTFSGLNIYYQGAEWTPGWVYLRHGDEKKLHAVNLSTMESSLIALNQQELERLLGSIFQNYSIQLLEGDRELLISELEMASLGKEIWYWFIILAIILLLTESMVSRHYKAESIT
ncbi:BatA domain-containing protein [soil metagenome]